MNPFYTIETINGQPYKLARPWFALALLPVFFVVAWYVRICELLKIGR